ncbi:hypothetical protein COLO4_14844 [Corchorus olitorius]|uniref:F-box domain-containing protein n=1 Tax=Corchorus olitorius TaxID=93759 RepID=A0A1R3JQP6_9ROSI|nr:hypothetical protein COLO4_14844 [Corchorus olitorius]
MSDYFNLPEELFAEILARLPIEDVVKSTAVCKSWNSLIKTPTFISAHLQKTISFNNSTNTHHLLFRICPKESLFQEEYSDDRVGEKYSLRFDNEDVEEYKQLNLPSNVESVNACFRVAGSINGTSNWDGRDRHGEEVKQNHLWVMKEYGVAMSWTKVFTEVAKSVPRVLFFREDEEQVFVTVEGGWVASLDIKNKSAEVLGVRAVDSLKGYPVIDGFVESLVLLDKANACLDVDASDEDPQEDAKSVDGSNEKGALEVDASSVDDDFDESSSADDNPDENVAPPECSIC